MNSDIHEVAIACIFGIVALLIGAAYKSNVLESLPSNKVHHYKLSDGTRITCKGIQDVRACGMMLSNCTDGREYNCQTNVIEIEVTP